jgi:hypothetical protein
MTWKICNGLPLAYALIVAHCSGTEPVPPFLVYWDISHNVVDEYQPSGRYSVLVDHLAPFGFQFTEGTTSLDSVDLNAYDVLVLANGSFATFFPSIAEIAAVESFVRSGGGLLILSEIAGSSGVAKIQQFANLFSAQVGLARFPPDDVFSTNVGLHPSVAGVDQIYLRFSSTIEPGILTPYAFYESMPMLAAGHYGAGRVVLIADGDLFTYASEGFGAKYFDFADNRLLAESVFRYLVVPEASTAILSMLAAATILLGARRRPGQVVATHRSSAKFADAVYSR